VLKALIVMTALLTAVPSMADERWVERTLRSMTVDEKVGQLLVPVARGGFRNVESEDFSILRRDIAELHAGGYHVALGDPAGTAMLINDMQRTAKVPLMITADFEGGVGYVIPGATRFPLAMAIGATGSEDYAYQVGKATAIEGRAIGVGVNFYPVVDVQNNPANPIINIRSFGEDPKKVSSMAAAYVRGSQEAGMLATAKHFPGHGDVSSDSHLELPVLDITRERMDAVELPPFRAAIDAGVAAVMTAHIYLPQLDSEKGLPATLSRNVLTTLLRDDLGFKGLLFTDALDMRGVSGHFTNEEAAVRSLLAGNDVLLFPPDPVASFNAVKGAIESGRLPMARLDDAVRRILRAKSQLGLNRYKPADFSRLSTVVGSKAHRDLSQKISDSSVTLVRDNASAVPLKLAEGERLLHVNLLDNRSGWREGPVGRALNAELPKRYRTTSIELDNLSSANEYEITRRLADMADAVVVAAFIRVAAYKGSIDLTPQQLSLLRDLSKMKKPFVFVLFGSPYLLHHVPELPSYVLTYDTNPGAERAVVKAIAGEIPIQGKLPISLPGLYPVGHGLTR
jgi:beta-N-acetylhexosaminidase